MLTVRNYNQIKKSNFRDVLRQSALNILSLYSSISRDERYLSQPRVQFLYIHHVFEDEEDQLMRLIKKLNEVHTFISYSHAVELILKGEIDKPYVVFSSDDGFKNNIRAGKILSDFGISACFFVNPSIIGESNIESLTKYCRDRLHFPPVEFLTWSDLNSLQNLGHEIGSHSWEHLKLIEYSYDKILYDLKKSKVILEQECGGIRHFAFPYGSFEYLNNNIRNACFEVGFDSLATAERGCHVNPDRNLQKNELCLLRDHIILDWRIDHMIYFLINSAKNSSSNNNIYPFEI